MNRTDIQTLDHGNVLAMADCAPLLSANGLDTFEKIMAAKSEPVSYTHLTLPTIYSV